MALLGDRLVLVKGPNGANDDSRRGKEEGCTEEDAATRLVGSQIVDEVRHDERFGQRLVHVRSLLTRRRYSVRHLLCR